MQTVSLRGATVLSCGLGEDASFDVELAATFGATVIAVDPTPRAVQHFAALIERRGLPAECDYSRNGRQPVESYELSGIAESQLRLVEVALADRCGRVRFYAPPSDESVSHSIVNFQNNYSTETPFIEVEAMDIQTLLRTQRIGDLALAKFDIEGAEIIVLPDLIRSGIRPEQLLVEFDELNMPSRASRRKFDRVHGELLGAGYRAVYFDGRSCVSYLLTGDSRR